MKLLIILFGFLLFNGIITEDTLEKNSITLQNFKEWSKKYGKVIEDHEFKRKFEIYLQNSKIVQELNKIYKGQTEFELNHFADLTADEFKSKILMKPKEAPKHSAGKYLKVEDAKDLPDTFDWRDHGAVTPVKDQGLAGTCWAFSTVQTVEGEFFLKGNKLTSLSVEQVVDCDGSSDPSNGNADCGVNGGWPYLAFEYIERAGGMVAEEDYPYCVGSGKCQPCEAPGYDEKDCGQASKRCLLKDSCQAKFNSSQLIPNLKVVDWKAISENEIEIAQQLMNLGPLSVALNAQLLQFYFRGIFNPIFCNPKALDHAVLLVGWGTHHSIIHGQQDYWIVKNSWGSRWGESGYFRIIRNKGKCGINTQVTTAVLQ